VARRNPDLLYCDRFEVCRSTLLKLRTEAATDMRARAMGWHLWPADGVVLCTACVGKVREVRQRVVPFEDEQPLFEVGEADAPKRDTY
jgi:hypothetical protein